MDDAVAVEHQPDVAAPEGEVAASSLRAGDGAPKRTLLAAVARAAAAAGVERLLHQARAVQPQAVPPAPAVGRAEVALGHAGGVGLEQFADGRQVRGPHPAVRGGEEAALGRAARQQGVEGELAPRRRLQRRGGEDVGAQGDDPVRRRARARRQGGLPHPADVPVPPRLAVGVAVARAQHGEGLAMQELVDLLGRRGGGGQDRRLPGGAHARPGRDVAGGGDDALAVGEGGAVEHRAAHGRAP